MADPEKGTQSYGERDLSTMGTDARRWAREFCRLFPDPGADDAFEDLMAGWFANAIETGRLAGGGVQAQKSPRK